MMISEKKLGAERMMFIVAAGLIIAAIIMGQKHSIAHKKQKIEHRARQMGYDLYFSE